MVTSVRFFPTPAVGENAARPGSRDLLQRFPADFNYNTQLSPIPATCKSRRAASWTVDNMQICSQGRSDDPGTSWARSRSACRLPVEGSPEGAAGNGRTGPSSRSRRRYFARIFEPDTVIKGWVQQTDYGKFIKSGKHGPSGEHRNPELIDITGPRPSPG